MNHRIVEANYVLVLMYHEIRVGRNPWEQRYFVAPARFSDHVRALRTAGYHLCSLTDFCVWATGRGELPANSVLLTFDDGYSGVFEHAYPILHNAGIPFAVFVVSSAIGATDAWMRSINGDHPAYPLMSRGQVAEVANAGVGIGSHSRHHADLPTLDAEALRDEVYGSRAELEDLLGQKVDSFAYPYGRLNDSVRATVGDAGYACGFSTRSGFNRPGSDPLLIRRIDVYGTDTARSLLRKMRFGTNDGSLQSTVRYYARRALSRRKLAEM